MFIIFLASSSFIHSVGRVLETDQVLTLMSLLHASGLSGRTGRQTSGLGMETLGELKEH